MIRSFRQSIRTTFILLLVLIGMTTLTFVFKVSFIKHLTMVDVSIWNDPGMNVTNITFTHANKTQQENSSGDTTILLWYVPTRYINNTPHLEPLPDCNITNCYMTTNKSYMNISQAVIFNAELILFPNPPARGFKDQIWVFQNQEPSLPERVSVVKFKNEAWRDKFNWTFWFRPDADLYAPFGIVVKKEKVVERNWEEIVRNKTKKVAWMVSRCGSHSRREQYVNLLSKIVPIDEYGGCRKGKRWPRGHVKEFSDLLNRDYKFYLSFENSFSGDYISEKFFLYYKNDLIVIVRGAGNYSAIAPDNTYLNTKDFNSIAELGAHLNYLLNNDTAYIEMLKRKDQYTAITIPQITVVNGQVAYIHHQYEQKSMCEMCRRSRNPEKYRKTYKRVDKWFDQQPLYNPTDIK